MNQQSSCGHKVIYIYFGTMDVNAINHHHQARRPAQKSLRTVKGFVNLAHGLNWGVLVDTLAVDDLGAGLGEDGVDAFGDGAAVANVGDEHGWASLGAGAAAATADLDGSAVHVHLAVTGLVEPGPGEEGIAAGGVSGDGEVVAVGEWAASHHGLDDLEGGASVEGEGDLARSTVVGGAAGEGELVGLASVVLSSGGSSVLVVSLAREVRAWKGGSANCFLISLDTIRDGITYR